MGKTTNQLCFSGKHPAFSNTPNMALVDGYDSDESAGKAKRPRGFGSLIFPMGHPLEMGNL
jgi:hypothetical protein